MKNSPSSKTTTAGNVFSRAADSLKGYAGHAAAQAITRAGVLTTAFAPLMAGCTIETSRPHHHVVYEQPAPAPVPAKPQPKVWAVDCYEGLEFGDYGCEEHSITCVVADDKYFDTYNQAGYGTVTDLVFDLEGREIARYPAEDCLETRDNECSPDYYVNLNYCYE